MGVERQILGLCRDTADIEKRAVRPIPPETGHSLVSHLYVTDFASQVKHRVETLVE